jgi:DNA-binding SARP family transcriptional activator
MEQHDCVGRDPAAPFALTGPVVEDRLLWRDRLGGVLPSLRSARVGLIVAPAGSGKSTLLGQLSSALGAPSGTYLAESGDSSAAAFARRVAHALTPVVATVDPSPSTVDRLVDSLDTSLDRRTLLVIDDFHLLSGFAAERECARLVERAPPLLTVLIASRTRPALNLPRLRASGAVVEVGADELRFRSWEVERLFRDVYREPLPPEAIADLTRRTDGWAAGLQLFHLATRGRSPTERRRTLAGLGRRWDLIREYLARNVVDDLPSDLRRFLLDTCVLTRLSGALCDSFLDCTGSTQILRELERRQIFTEALPDGGYRYHEVLRAHLEAAFVEERSDDEARAWYRRAGLLLETDGFPADALRAYCRGEAWDELGRLLGRDGETALRGRAEWIELLPAALVRDDPWLLLASARQQRAAGRLEQAIALYREAERLFPSNAASGIALRERLALGPWADPRVQPDGDVLGLLRQATIREPLSVQRRASAMSLPDGRLVAGLAALLAGHADDAIELLATAADDAEADPLHAAAARTGLAIALLLAGEIRGIAVAEQAAEEAERLGSDFLVRLSWSAVALTGDRDGMLEAEAARVTSEVAGDRWGRMLAMLLEGWGALCAGEDAEELLEATADEARALGAGVLEAWARSARALSEARAGAAESHHGALQAEVAARLVGAKAAQGLTYLALAEHGGNAASDYFELARAVETECGLQLPAAAARRTEREPTLELRCFGGFRMRIHGREVELSAAKPRARSVLRYLALFAGRPVHREVLMEALWPGGDAEAGTRHLHVLISTLRRVLEPHAGRGASQLILREGEAYRLSLPPGARVDVVEFDRALVEGRAALTAGDNERASAAFARALDLYRGELLPEDGPADWAVAEREYRRAEVCEAAFALGRMLLEAGKPLAAASVCERALHADRYEDAIWRLCVSAYEHAGDTAAAERTRRKYQNVLAELGLNSV